MTTFRDIFAGRYIVLHEDGMPVKNGATDLDGRPFKYKATHPTHVRWFTTFDGARAFRDRNVVNGTVHRVEHLEILQEKFSY